MSDEVTLENVLLHEHEQAHRMTVALQEAAAELRRAMQKFAPIHSGHEGFAVIREELDELWDDVKRDDLTAAKREAVQVAAMALRFIVDLPDGQSCEASGGGP